MKLAILCLSSGIGGLELYALREYRALQSRGIECMAVVAPGSKLEQQFQSEGIAVSTLKVSSRKLPLLAAFQLASLFKREGVDTVHMHWAKDLPLAALTRRLQAFRLVYTRHMEITRSKRDWLHRFLYRQVDLFLTITDQMRDQALDYLPLPKEKVQRLYLGVRGPQVNAAREDFFSDGFPRRRLNLALFGRMEQGKGQHLLMEALSELIAQGMDISATLVGHVMDREYRADLARKVRERGLDAYIRFIDFIDQPIDVMAQFDAVVLTTYRETFGLVLPEAMRAGVAVIGSDAGGVPEIIDHGETGLLFKSGDSQSLAAVIAEYYHHPERRLKTAQAGRQKADRVFAEEAHFDRLASQLGLLHGSEAAGK